MKSNLKKFLTCIYGYEFFNSFVLLYPVYAIMFQDNGMSDMQISILLIIWSISVLIFQLPLNMLTDRFSNKQIVLYGQTLKAFCFIVWILWPTFLGYTIGFILWGLQWAIYNSPFEALVYEELKNRRKKHLYTKVCGVKNAFNTLGYILSALGSFLLFMGYGGLTILSVLAIILSIICLLPIPNRAPIPSYEIIKAWGSFWIGLSVFKKSPKPLFWIILLTTIIGLTCIDEYFGLIGLGMGVKKEYVGLIFIFTLIAHSIGNLTAYHLERKSDSFIYGVTIVLGTLFMLIFWSYNLISIAILTLCFFVYGILKVLIFSRLQHSTHSKVRTVILGYYSVFEQIMSILSYLVMMLGVYLGGYQYGFLILGFTLGMTGLIYLILNSNKWLKHRLKRAG